MSLSQKIIYGSTQEVRKALATNPELNVIDEYGYTPLIQTAIINSIPKAELLLAKGAISDFKDLTGRTALFWAADNNNLELCKLCLKYGADPNAYATSGQPLLVMPLMKQYQDIKNLLLSHGANLNFAQDFLNAKLLGHLFELEGRVAIVDTRNTFIEVELEGFYLRFTLEIMANSLHEFQHNYGAKKLRHYFGQLNIIRQALDRAINLIRLQHYLIEVEHFFPYINSLLPIEPLILPISFGGHAITLIRFYDWLIRCDRGAYGVAHGTVIYYTMQYPARLTPQLCRDLLYKRQYPEFINEGLVDYLGLTPQRTLNLPPQQAGICAWANVVAVLPALMLLLLYDERGNELSQWEQEVLEFYYAWQEWHKNRSLDFCLASLTTASPARHAAKAALIAAILLQACNYNNPADRPKANKILAVLTQPDTLKVLESYVRVYSKEPNNPMWKSFVNYLAEWGIDSAQFLQDVKNAD